MNISATILDINAFRKTVRPSTDSAPTTTCQKCPYKFVLAMMDEMLEAIKKDEARKRTPAAMSD